MPHQQGLAPGSRHHPVYRRHHQRLVTRPLASDHIRVALLQRRDSMAMLSMLGRCSARSLYRRFHGPTGGVPYLQSRLADADNGESYVAWAGDACVGFGNIHVCGDTADIGLLVEDHWQRRGVGTALLNELVCHARNNDARLLRADVLAGEDRFVLQSLSRVGEMTTSLEFGVYTATVDMRTALRVPVRSARSAPSTNIPDRPVRRSVGDQPS